jgi:WD40 repeat protein
VEIRCFETAARQGVLELTSGSAQRLAFRPGTQMLAIGRASGSVLLWDAASHGTTCMRGHSRGAMASLAWDRAGRIVVGATSARWVTAWDADGNKRISKLSLPDDVDAESMQITEDAGAAVFINQKEHALWVFDLASGRLMWSFPMMSGWRDICFLPHTPDLALVAGNYRGRNMVAWYDIRKRRIEKLADLPHPLCTAALSPDRERLVGATGASHSEIVVIDLRTGGTTPLGEALDEVRTVGCSAGAQRVVCCGGSILSLFPMNRGGLQAAPRPPGHTRWVRGFAVDDGGQYMASEGGEGAVILWQLPRRAEAERVGTSWDCSVWSVAASASSRHLALVLGKPRESRPEVLAVRTWTGRERKKFPVPNDDFNCLLWWRDQAVVLVGQAVNDIWLWMVGETKLRRLRLGKAISELHVETACCVQDDLWLVTSDQHIYTVPLHAPQQWQCRKLPGDLRLWQGRMVVDASGRYVAIRSCGEVVVVENGDVQQAWVATGNISDLSPADVALSPGGEMLAVAFSDSTRFWDLQTRACVGTLEAHGAGFSAIAFSRDASLFFTGHENGLISAWKLHVPKKRLPG